jgi:hypothetical protein
MLEKILKEHYLLLLLPLWLLLLLLLLLLPHPVTPTGCEATFFDLQDPETGPMCHTCATTPDRDGHTVVQVRPARSLHVRQHIRGCLCGTGFTLCICAVLMQPFGVLQCVA